MLCGSIGFPNVYDDSIRELVEETLTILLEGPVYPADQAVEWEEERFPEALNCGGSQADTFPVIIDQTQVDQ